MATKRTRSTTQAIPLPNMPLSQDGPARICAVGVGGGGSNAIMRMMRARPVPGVSYACVNTDLKALGQADGANVVHIGENLTRGLGAGGDPDMGARAAGESKQELKKIINGADLVFLAIGMGGGTGTGAAPIVADMARQAGALVVAVATTPFSFEGARRLETAHSGITELTSHVDNLIVIHNDRLLSLFEGKTSMEEALRAADDAVMLGVLSVAELVNLPGEINVDLADVKAIMKIPGKAMMAIGEARGEGGPLEAAKRAVNNPLLDVSLEGAKGVLFNVTGGPSMTLGEVNEAGEYIASQVDHRAMIFFGMVNGDAKDDLIRMTLIATGIGDEGPDGYGYLEGAYPLSPTSSPGFQGSFPREEVDLDLPPFLRRNTIR
ncbi:MAG: cell division protein FtsZ [Chloroflexota bacterium]|nr:cell division protein FtsZ [Chloroflexota bacterium]